MHYWSCLRLAAVALIWSMTNTGTKVKYIWISLLNNASCTNLSAICLFFSLRCEHKPLNPSNYWYLNASIMFQASWLCQTSLVQKLTCKRLLFRSWLIQCLSSKVVEAPTLLHEIFHQPWRLRLTCAQSPLWSSHLFPWSLLGLHNQSFWNEQHQFVGSCWCGGRWGRGGWIPLSVMLVILKQNM